MRTTLAFDSKVVKFIEKKTPLSYLNINVFKKKERQKERNNTVHHLLIHLILDKPLNN